MLGIRNLSYEIDGKTIFNNLNLEIEEGAFTVITGPNGGGKSTLAKLIMGILQPTTGEIIFDNKNIINRSLTERAEMGIAVSFQQPVRIKGISVLELIEIAANDSLSPGEVAGYLKKVGLEPDLYIRRELDSGLSGGELKRIEIASILARRAKLLIFDEPEAGIDLWGFDNLIKIFSEFKKTKQTVVVISHQERILKIASKIIVLENGKTMQYNSPERVLSRVLKDSSNGTK